MNTHIPNDRKRSTWKLAAELLFVAWVIVVSFLYYAQFKDVAIKLLRSLLHR
jgi:hypothetical protein